MSDLSPLSGEERKSNFGAVRSVDDPERSFGARVAAPKLLGLSAKLLGISVFGGRDEVSAHLRHAGWRKPFR